MTNLTNFNRDMSWIDPDIAPIGFEDLPNCSLDGNVYDKHAIAVSDTSAVTTSTTACFGLAYLPPTEEATPFRIKADASVNGDGSLVMGFGYAENNIIAGANLMTGVRIFGFPQGTIYDDVWAVRPSVINADKPIIFFCGITLATSANVACKLTVQRLLGKPDNFSSAVS